MKKSRRSSFVLALILGVLTFISAINAQCFGKQETKTESSIYNENSKKVTREPSPFSESIRPEGFQQVLYDRQLEFTLNLFHKLYKKDDKSNLFFSPHSIHQALMLAFFGASGQTELQLRRALELSDAPKNELVRQFKMENYFMEARAANTTQYNLKIANKIFFSDKEPVRDCVQEILDTEIERLNFVNKTEESRIKINSWVETNTDGKIRDIIPSGYITKQTRLAIANSAYFKGSWEQQFKKSHTRVSLFYISQKEVTQTMMMYQKGSFRHGASETLRSYVIELPYEGEAISMYILLPPFTPNALEETISRLNASSLREAIDQNQLYHESIEISLPRFKIDQTFELNKALESIGVVDLFDSSKADLSEFSEQPELSIGTAIHKSYVEVNEEGSEAAAATVLIDTRSGRPLEQTKFICNHPFIFFIHDNAANTVLFMGAFRNPKLTQKH